MASIKWFIGAEASVPKVKRLRSVPQRNFLKGVTIGQILNEEEGFDMETPSRGFICEEAPAGGIQPTITGAWRILAYHNLEEERDITMMGNRMKLIYGDDITRVIDWNPQSEKWYRDNGVICGPFTDPSVAYAAIQQLTKSKDKAGLK